MNGRHKGLGKNAKRLFMCEKCLKSTVQTTHKATSALTLGPLKSRPASTNG